MLPLTDHPDWAPAFAGELPPFLIKPEKARMTDATNPVAPDPIPRITRDDPAAGSGDVVAENVAALKRLFPAIVTDGRVDFDVLRQLLGDTVEEGAERYGLNWKGKTRARAFALTPSLGTLRPARADSKDWDRTRNIVIEGDNLEVLKLLRKSYAGRVKLIYIDPPYNTGKDFVYPDNYTDSLANYETLTGQRGADGARLTSNKEASGRFHTDWLNMMYPRLMLAKELLHENGVLCINIDDRELDSVRALLREIVGEENALGTIVRATGTTTGQDSGGLGSSFDYIVCYSRNSDFVISGLPLSDKDKERFQDSDERGFYSTLQLRKTGNADRRHDRPSMFYPIKTPDGSMVLPLGPGGYESRWRFGPSAYKDAVENDLIVWKLMDGGYKPYVKYYSDGRTKRPSPLFDDIDGNKKATIEVKQLLAENVFSNPKPVELLSRLQLIFADPSSIILDFFAGSGTTGHAVMAQNAADGGDRRYILVQLPEPLDPAKAEQKTAADFCDRLGRPRTIAELTKERLRRAGEKVRADNPAADVDTGFRVYKLATSNLKPWQPGPDLAADLLDAADNLLPGRSEDDLLAELLLKTGVDLVLPGETRTVTQRTVHAFGGGTLIVCLADIPAHAATALGEGICDWLEVLDPPGRTTFFFRDTAFDPGGNHAAEAKANLAATLRQRRGDARIEKLGAI